MNEQVSTFINQVSPTAWSAVSSWPFISCCVCIAILILTFKRAFNQLWPKIYATSQAHGVFTLMYLVLGLLSAVPKTYLPATSFFQRAILGVIASGASLAVYHAIIKRLSGIIGVKDRYLVDPDEEVVNIKSTETLTSEKSIEVTKEVTKTADSAK